MAERRDRIPPIVERTDGIDRAMPLTLFGGKATDAILKRENGLIIPQGAKIIFEISKGPNPNHPMFDSLGTITLEQEFEGAFAAKYDEAYTTMPYYSSRVALIPETDDRRELMGELKTITEYITPLYLQQAKRGVEQKLALGKEKQKAISQAVDEIDSVLLQEFLEQRQGDLDFFDIDPDTVIKARIQIAVDKKITAEPWPAQMPSVSIQSHPMIYNPHPAAYE